jgi:predicted MFS family arabinose efflux permease
MTGARWWGSPPERLAVLREREYRLLLCAQAISLLGDAMVSVALVFAVIEVGGGASGLGVVLAARSIAVVACLLLGGVVADRYPRQIVLVTTDLVRLVSQGTLAVSLILGSPHIWVLALLSALTGAGTGFFNPTSMGFLPSVVSKSALQHANALRGLASSGGRILGPLLAGLLVTTAGAGWALAVDAMTFGISAVFVASMHVPASDRSSHQSMLADMREGWQAFRSRRWLWTFVAWVSFGNVLFGCWSIVGPLVAHRDLGGAAAWSAIVAASGVGGIVGGIVALRTHPRRPLVFATVTLTIFFVPLGLLAAGLSVAIVAVGAGVSEIGLIVGMTSWESTLQGNIDPSQLSRVAAYDWFGSLAFQPLGLAVWGVVAASVGYHTCLWVAFGLAIASAAVLLLAGDVRSLSSQAATTTA